MLLGTLPIADSQAPLPLPTNHTTLLTLVWLKGDHPDDDAREIVESMLRQSCGPYGTTATIGGDAQLAWAMLLPETFGPLTCWSMYTNGFELCLVEGDMYGDLPGLKLQPGNNPDLARRIAAHMREHPERRLNDLNGIYSGVYVNRDRSCVYVFGDLTGTRPMFWLSDDKRFVVTGNLWAFRGCDGFERRWDNMALMEILTIGFPMAGRTWMASVKQLQRGKQIRSYRDGRTEVLSLLRPISRQPWSIQQSVRALRESMDETMGRICRRLDRPFGLALSGGLDSRILLASLRTQSVKHHNFTFCFDPEEADNQIAGSLSRIFGLQHSPVLLNSATAARMHRDFRLINEGDSPGYGFCLLAAEAQRNVNTVMIGYESMRIDPPGAFDPFSLKTKQDLAKSMLRGYMTLFTSRQASRITAPEHSVSWHDVLDEWFGSFEQIEEDSIIDVCLNHMTDYKHQRVIRARIDAARWFCLPVYPYMDNQLYTAYYSLPVAHLKGDQAHLALLSDYKLGLENVHAAAQHFGIPMHDEYRYHHVVHLGRVVKERFLTPLRTKWLQTKGTLGFGTSALYSHWEPELKKLEHCGLFNWATVNNYIQQARRGAFVNRNAIECLIKALVINEFLFNSSPSVDPSLKLVKSQQNIQFVRQSCEIPRQS